MGVNHWQLCQELTEAGTTFVMVTMTGARGSTPQDPGAKIIVSRQGLHAGTVGGGKVEMAAIKKAQSMLESNKQLEPEYVTWNLQKDICLLYTSDAADE